MQNLKTILTTNSKKIEDAFLIRNKVFTQEQGISSDLDKDGKDNKAEHIITYLKNKPVGTLRIRRIQNKIKLKRMAVLQKQRGKRIGTKMINFLINYFENKNIKEIYLHTQMRTKSFYKKNGFKTRGKSFEKVGIKHIEMYRLF